MKKLHPPTIATGTGAMSVTTSVNGVFRLVWVSVHFSSAPTTADVLTITIDAGDGAAYDTVLYSVTPSSGSLTDILYIPSVDLYVPASDQIKVAFTNTDARTYGVRIITEADK